MSATAAVNSSSHSRKPVWKVEDITFTADFDGGRLGSARRTADGYYELTIPSDCEELHHRNEYRIWYCFAIVGGTPHTTIKCRISNMHQIAKVYNNDLRPLVRVCTESAHWERLQQPCDFLIKPNLDLQLTFEYTFVSAAPVYFAFYYPFPYTDCQRLLDNIDKALPSIGALSGKSDDALKVTGTAAAADAIYYHRELLVLTPDGRRVELLTISSRQGIMAEREPYIDGPGLFPRSATELRPHRFKGKPGVFISARVHPGETAASYMVHGLIALLLQPRNPYARALRSAFVFKIVPMLNPDGVARGHFRLDQFGMNLNRCYATPSPRQQPAIYAVKAILKQIATLCTPVGLGESSKAGRALHSTPNGLFMYLDLHAYSAKQGCYLLGNNLTPHKEARILTFSHLIQLYSPQFNAFACSFGATRRKKRDIQPKRDTSDELARRKLRNLEEMQYQLMFGMPASPAAAIPRIVVPSIVRYGYSKPHIHAAEPTALALITSSLTKHTSTPADTAVTTAGVSSTVSSAEVKNAGLLRTSTFAHFSSSGSKAVETSLSDGTNKQTTTSLSEANEVEDDGTDDGEDDSVSTTSEGESDDDSQADSNNLTIAPSVNLNASQISEMLKLAVQVFGLESTTETSDDAPVVTHGIPHALGFSLLPGRRLRVLDSTGLRYTTLLGQGVRAGAADAILHDSECRKLTKEWQAMKAKASAAGSGGPGDALGALASRGSSLPLPSSLSLSRNGELKKGGTGRVAIHKDFECAHSYTVECSCNLLTHAAALHRQTMFEDIDANPDDFPVLKSKNNAATVVESPLDLALYNEYANVFEQAYVQHDEQTKDTSSKSAKPGDTVKYVRIVCPWASRPLESQIDTRIGIQRSSVVTAIAHHYMCQVDSLQPPIGVLASQTGKTGAASSPSVQNPATSQFVTPFGIPVLTAPTSPTTCTWGTCPADPPAVFASVGRAVAFALLDLIGATCAREAGVSTINVPPPGFHSLQSRLSATYWKNMSGLHRWSRIMLEAEQLKPEDLLNPSGFLAEAPNKKAVSKGDEKRSGTELSSLPIRMLTAPPSQNIDVVLFPKPVATAYLMDELKHFKHLLPEEKPPAPPAAALGMPSGSSLITRVPSSTPITPTASTARSVLSPLRRTDETEGSKEVSPVVNAGKAVLGIPLRASGKGPAAADGNSIRRIASWAAADRAPLLRTSLVLKPVDGFTGDSSARTATKPSVVEEKDPVRTSTLPVRSAADVRVSPAAGSSPTPTSSLTLPVSFSRNLRIS